MKKVFILSFMTITVLGTMLSGAVLGADEDFPKREVMFYTPWGPGGALSMAMRAISLKTSEVLGGKVIVGVKPGAGGTVLAEHIANSKPDGYELFIFNSATNGITIAARPVKFSNSDFDLICQTMRMAMVFVVASDSPFKTLDDLIRYAKEHPGELKSATTGIGTSSHFSMLLFSQLTGVEIGYVPFNGSHEAHPAVMGHHVDMTMSYFADSKPLIRAGKLRPLAQPSKERLKELSDVPTFGELGYPEVVFDCWYGPAVRKGVPKPILDKLRHAFSVAAQDPETVKEIANTGFIPYYRNWSDFQEFVKESVESYKRIAEKANIRLEAYH
jgi:tripartite-type tricarboxylate transporter receptor subunit TctC